MARKKKEKNSARLEFSDIVIAFLLALAGGVAAFTVIAVAGSIMFPDAGKTATADQPPAQTVRGTLPSRAPEPTATPAPAEPSEEPSNEPEPEPSAEPNQQTAVPTQTSAPVQTSAPSPTPTQAPTPAPTRTPATQNPAPAVSIQPAAQSQAPAQSGTQGSTISNGDGTYTHDFSGGRVLATTQSNNNGDPVYHIKNCRAAKIISPENAYWYPSAQAAIDDGRRICGYCD